VEWLLSVDIELNPSQHFDSCRGIKSDGVSSHVLKYRQTPIPFPLPTLPGAAHAAEGPTDSHHSYGSKFWPEKCQKR